MDKWLLSVAVNKAVRRVASFIVATVVTWIGKAGLEKFGVNVTIDPVVATGAVFAGLEVARNYLKHKVGLKWI